MKRCSSATPIYYHAFPKNASVFLRKIEKVFINVVNISVDKLIELFSFEENLDEIILTEFGQYRGVLNKSAIIKIISEKRIVEARNQNPLTKLAGNSEKIKNKDIVIFDVSYNSHSAFYKVKSIARNII